MSQKMLRTGLMLGITVAVMGADAAPVERAADSMPLVGTVKSVAADKATFVVTSGQQDYLIRVKATTTYKTGAEIGPSKNPQAQASWEFVRQGEDADFDKAVVAGKDVVVEFSGGAARVIQVAKKN